MKTIARGAEAVLRTEKQEQGIVLVKDRVRKGYRVPELDRKIRTQRTRTEERMLSKARRSGVNAPIVWSSSGTEIVMELLDGPTVKDSLNTLPEKEQLDVYSEIGRSAANLHKSGIMHGDLTTSNMILVEGKLYIIDFGLSKSSKRVEDHAVDLFLLYEALKAAHYWFLDEAWKNIIKAYKYNYTIADKVLKRFYEIEKRRRYKAD